MMSGMGKQTLETHKPGVGHSLLSFFTYKMGEGARNMWSWGQGYNSAEEHMLNQALDLIPNTTKEKKREKKQICVLQLEVSWQRW